MNLQSLLNQFMGVNNSQNAPTQTSAFPGSFAGGAAAGGLAALVMGNKKARKVAGKAATVGGAALLGGLAYSAFRNWQHNQQAPAQSLAAQPVPSAERFEATATLDASFQLTLIKGMIAAAKADGHIDETEQERIFSSVDNLQLSSDEKATVLDLFRYPATVAELAQLAATIEQKTELYLISCFAIVNDHHREREHLNDLAQALNLPPDLAAQLELQANQAALQAA